MAEDSKILDELRRIASALESLSGQSAPPQFKEGCQAYVWNTHPVRLDAVETVSRVPLVLLKGIDQQRDQLLENTKRFSHGFSANNALLWGARGTGKSSLVKAIHAETLSDAPLTMIEIHREDLESLPTLLSLLATEPEKRFIVFCDDLAFEGGESSYKFLKATLEGGIEGKPANVIFYATSNRRHLMAREMIDNEQSTAITPSEAVEEKVSLSDRFGLWLGFHGIDQETYLTMVYGYADAIDLVEYSSPTRRKLLRQRALEWSITRGSRSGRVAWQFITDIAGEEGIKITLEGHQRT